MHGRHGMSGWWWIQPQQSCELIPFQCFPNIQSKTIIETGNIENANTPMWFPKIRVANAAANLFSPFGMLYHGAKSDSIASIFSQCYTVTNSNIKIQRYEIQHIPTARLLPCVPLQIIYIYIRKCVVWWAQDARVFCAVTWRPQRCTGWRQKADAPLTDDLWRMKGSNGRKTEGVLKWCRSAIRFCDPDLPTSVTSFCCQ